MGGLEHGAIGQPASMTHVDAVAGGSGGARAEGQILPKEAGGRAVPAGDLAGGRTELGEVDVERRGELDLFRIFPAVVELSRGDAGKREEGAQYDCGSGHGLAAAWFALGAQLLRPATKNERKRRHGDTDHGK